MRNLDPKLFRNREVDRTIEFAQLLHRHGRGRLAFDDLVDVLCRTDRLGDPGGNRPPACRVVLQPHPSAAAVSREVDTNYGNVAVGVDCDVLVETHHQVGQ